MLQCNNVFLQGTNNITNIYCSKKCFHSCAVKEEKQNDLTITPLPWTVPQLLCWAPETLILQYGDNQIKINKCTIHNPLPN